MAHIIYAEINLKILLLGAILFFGISLQAQTRLPVENFARLPVMENPVLSPDGRFIAAHTSHFGRRSVGIFKVTTAGDDAPIEPVHLLVDDPDYIVSFQWANNDRLILRVRRVIDSRWRGYSDDIKIASVDKSGQLFFYLEPKNNAARCSTAGDSYVVDMLEKDDTHIIAWYQANACSPRSLNKVNVYTGESTPVELDASAPGYHLVDSDGVAIFAVESEFEVEFLKSEYTINVFHKPAPDKNWEKIPDTSVLQEKKLRPVRLHESRPEIMLVKPVFGESLLHTEEPSYTGLLEFDPFQNRILGPYLIEENESARTAATPFVPGQHVRVHGKNRENTRFILWAGHHGQQGSFYIMDRKLNRFNRITPPYPALENLETAVTEVVSFRNRDGIEIKGYLTIPSGKPRENLPLVVYVPDKEMQNLDGEYDPFVQFLTNRGFAVFQPLYRGLPGLGEQYYISGRSLIAYSGFNDVTDGVKWLIESKVADPNRICISGRYEGGYVAALSLARLPELYRCGISYNGFYDVDFLRRNHDVKFYDPEGNRAEAKEISPFNLASEIKQPLLIMVSKNDLGEEPLQTKKFYERVKKVNENVQFVRLSALLPWLTNEEYEIERLRLIDEFLASHLAN